MFTWNSVYYTLLEQLIKVILHQKYKTTLKLVYLKLLSLIANEV